MSTTPHNWFIAWPATHWTPVVDTTAWLADIGSDVATNATPVAQADWHVTLAFLGPCGDAAAHTAWQRALDRQAAGAAITVEPRRWALLGRNALAVSVDSAANTLADRIAAQRDALRRAAGLADEGRPPLPHITVARLTRQPSLDTFRQTLAHTTVPAARCRLDALALYTRSAHTVPRFRQVAIAPSFASPE